MTRFLSLSFWNIIEAVKIVFPWLAQEVPGVSFSVLFAMGTPKAYLHTEV